VGASSTAPANGRAPVYQNDHHASNFSAGPFNEGIEPRGIDTTLNGTQVYMIGRKHDSSCVIVFPDLFGYKFTNTRLICDEIADAGFLVIMPDLYAGDQLDFGLPSASAQFGEWCKVHNKAQTAPICARILDYVEENIRPRLGVASVGYCFGGRYSVIANAAGRVRCSVVSCPSFLEPEEVAGIQTPTLWLCADTDRTFTAEEKVAAQKALADKYFESQFVTYPSTEHGFCTRFHPSKKGAAAASRDALARSIAFLKDTLYD
jgi:dienelactone hydrolase